MAVAAVLLGLAMIPVVSFVSWYLFLLGLGGWLRELEKAEPEDVEE